MTEDASPENLRKFLESDDPALVMMGLSMAKGSGVLDNLLEDILWMYMMHDDKTIRAMAKSTFMKMAPNKLKEIIKNNWKASYRTFSRPGERFTQVIRPLVQSISQDKLDKILSRLIGPVIVEAKGIRPHNNKTAKRKNNAVKALEDFGDIAVEPLIEILEDKETHNLYFKGYWAEKSFYFDGMYESDSPSSVYLKVDNVHRTPNTIAAKALGKIGDTRAVEPLITALVTWDAILIKSAKEALSKLGHEVSDTIAPALHYPETPKGDDKFTNPHNTAVSAAIPSIPPSLKPFSAAFRLEKRMYFSAEPKPHQKDVELVASYAGVSHGEARAALEECGGEPAEAIIKILDSRR